jgi:hypothetical protein
MFEKCPFRPILLIDILKMTIGILKLFLLKIGLIILQLDTIKRP